MFLFCRTKDRLRMVCGNKVDFRCDTKKVLDGTQTLSAKGFQQKALLRSEERAQTV
jgi:hypothetical protein